MAEGKLGMLWAALPLQVFQQTPDNKLLDQITLRSQLTINYSQMQTTASRASWKDPKQESPVLTERQNTNEVLETRKTCLGSWVLHPISRKADFPDGVFVLVSGAIFPAHRISADVSKDSPCTL